MQKLLAREEWDAACQEYEAFFPGFRAAWEAHALKRKANAAKHEAKVGS